MYLRYFIIIFPWKGCRPSFPQTSISFSQDAMCQAWLKWLTGSGEEDENVKSLRQQLQ